MTTQEYGEAILPTPVNQMNDAIGELLPLGLELEEGNEVNEDELNEALNNVTTILAANQEALSEQATAINGLIAYIGQIRKPTPPGHPGDDGKPIPRIN